MLAINSEKNRKRGGREGKERNFILSLPKKPRKPLLEKNNWDWSQKVLVFIEILWSTNKPDIKLWPILWKKDKRTKYEPQESWRLFHSETLEL